MSGPSGCAACHLWEAQLGDMVMPIHPEISGPEGLGIR